MKKLALLLSIMSFAAQAEVITHGGFGTDGASGESIPLATSVQDASKLYNALLVAPNAKGSKIVFINDESHFECQKPYRGISRLNSGCSFFLRASQKAQVVWGRQLSGTVQFTGKLATKLFAALPVDPSGRVGAMTKEVANVKCSMAVRPGVDAVCVIRDTNVISMDVNVPR